MSSAERDLAVEPAGFDDLAACCRWLGEAHAAADLQDSVAALCGLYDTLIARGWIPSDRAVTLLRLHAAGVDAELAQVLASR